MRNVKVFSDKMSLYFFTFVTVWVAYVTMYSLVRLSSPLYALDPNIFGLFANYLNATLFLIATLLLLFSKNRKSMLLPLLVLGLGGSVWMLVVGFLNGNATISAWKHVYLLLYGVVFYSFGKLIASIINFENLKILAIHGYVVNVISVVYFYVVSQLMFVYPGYGTQSIAYVSIFYLVYQRNWVFYLCSIIVVIQGKRSVLISYLVVLLLFFISKNGKQISVKILTSVVVIPLVLMILLFTIEFYGLGELAGLQRLSYINPFSNHFDLYMGSSGRVDELVGAFSVISENSMNYIFGVGAGFDFEWELTYREDFYEKKGYVHMTPALIFFVTGGLGLFLVYGKFYHVVVNSMVASYRQRNNMALFFSYCGVYFIISGFFSLNILVDIFGWLSMGICAAYGTKSNLDRVGK